MEAGSGGGPRDGPPAQPPLGLTDRGRRPRLLHWAPSTPPPHTAVPRPRHMATQDSALRGHSAPRNTGWCCGGAPSVHTPFPSSPQTSPRPLVPVMTPRPPPRPRRTRCRGVYASRPPPWSPRPQDGAAKPPSSWAAGRGRESSRLTGCGRDSGHLGWMEETCQVSSGPPTTPAGWGSSRGALQAVLCLRVHLSVRLSVCSLSAGRRGWLWSRLPGRARLAGLRGTPLQPPWISAPATQVPDCRVLCRELRFSRHGWGARPVATRCSAPRVTGGHRAGAAHGDVAGVARGMDA